MYFLRPHDLAEGRYTRRRIPIPLLHGLSTTVNFVFRIPENFYSIQYSRGRTDPQLSHARRKVFFTDNENTSGTLSDVIARYGQSLDRDESAKRHLRRHHLLHPLGLLAKPLRIPGGAVEHRCRFEQLELAARCRFHACSRISMLSMPVITTEVGKFRAYRTRCPIRDRDDTCVGQLSR